MGRRDRWIRFGIVYMIDASASFVEFDVDSAPFDDLRRACDHWLERRGDRFAPAWSDIDLLALPPAVIPRVCVVDVIDDAPARDFVYRFWGTAITDMHDMDLTGRSVRQVPPTDYAECLVTQYGRVVDGRRPMGFLNGFENDRGFRSEYAVMRAPLSSDGDRVDGVFSAETYGQDARQLHEFFQNFAASGARPT